MSLGRTRRTALVLGVVILAVSMPAPSGSVADSSGPGERCPSTAAARHNWGVPDRSDYFTDASALTSWYLYSGPGNAGNGLRTPDAVSFGDGVMAITGDGAGNTEGMGWNSGQLFGRWEVCAKSTPASPNYHSVLLLWPDSERWPADGEIDFMEIFDPQRQNVTASVLHVWPEDAGAVDHNYHTSIPIDATGWHSWAVEWTRDLVIGYVDGNEWFRVGQHVPRTSMHLCIQLDNFGGDVSEGGQLAVDWAHQYPLH